MVIPRPINLMPRTAVPRPTYRFASPAWHLAARGASPAQISRALHAAPSVHQAATSRAIDSAAAASHSSTASGHASASAARK